jgi:hypothetical protein
MSNRAREAVDVSRLKDCAIFPVRHHSPRTSAALRAFLDAVKPTVVMVEEPRDVAALIPHLFDADTEPPVAFLGYRTDGAPDSALWPMATYSPEYVAMKWAHERQVRVEPIDIATGEAIAHDARERAERHAAEESDSETETETETGSEPSSEPEDFLSDEAIAHAKGFRSFEELWEAWFEAPAYEPEDFRRAMFEWCELVRQRHSRTRDRARDARMARHILAEIDRGTPPGKIAVVVGGAHAAAMVAADIDLALEATIAPAVPTAVTLIPYSFTRLAAQVGYGAGNRAPRYYQRAHDAGCDYTRATLEVLIEFTEHLRVRGFAASLADTIEAYRLAVMLATLRGKHAPGLDEIRDASISTLCRGDKQHVDGFLWPSVIGKTVGKVGARIGRNSLQEEFWREVKAKGLPRSDEAEAFTLKLGDAVQVDTSVFLHRLRVADVPYATYRGSQAVAGAGQTPDDVAGGFDALARVREHWEAQWTPSTDVALVENIVHGDSLLQVAERRLTERLTGVIAAAEAAHVLMEAVVTRAPRVIAEALAATERLAAVDDDLASLAKAARALSGLVSYGSARSEDAASEEVILALCEKTFARAVLRVEGACQGDDAAVQPARQAMRILHELALAQPRIDRDLWFDTAHQLSRSDRIHPACAGLLAGLLYLAEKLSEEEVVALVSLRLSSLADPRAGAAFLEGFLGVNALVLVKNRAVVGALDQFVQAIAADRFRDMAPLLRRAFSGLGATERRYLLENLLAHRKIGASAQAAAQVLAEKDVDKLKEMSADIAAAMDDLDDLL